MFTTLIAANLIALSLSLNTAVSRPSGSLVSVDFDQSVYFQSARFNQPRTLAVRQFSLDNRYAVASVNEVFRKNILLNLAYLGKTVEKKSDIDWTAITSPFSVSFTLKPSEVFAYHDHVLPEYVGKVVATTNAHFSGQEGFVSDGYLFGDGVCHLASLINWATQDAGLEVRVTKDHNFAEIPDVPKEYGVSIYTNAADKNSGTRNNLYITNTLARDVEFHMVYTADHMLTVFVTEISSADKVFEL